MSGLDLLGQVCEKELKLKQEVKHSVEFMEEDDLDYDDTKVIDVKKEAVILSARPIVEIKQEQEYHEISVDPEDVIKSEVEDVVLFDPLHKEFNTKSLERSSQAKSTYLNIHDFGNFMYKIYENQFCKYSTFTGWHLQRSCGMMKISLKFHKINVSAGSLIVRALLVRKDETYRHFGVDLICEQHRKEIPQELIHHVLQAAPGLEHVSYLDNAGQRKSVCFRIGKVDSSGVMEATIGLKCICNDSCSTCEDPNFKPTESSRDLMLVLTLESVDYGVVLARRNIGIWPKAIVRPKDLNKPERRKPKGGAAQLNKKKEWMEKIQALESAAQKALAAAQPVPLQSLTPITLAQTSGSSSEPSSQESTTSSQGESEAGGKVCKLILKIPTQNKLPTSEEILRPSVNFVVKTARKAGYSKEDLVKLISETYDQIPTEINSQEQ